MLASGPDGRIDELDLSIVGWVLVGCALAIVLSIAIPAAYHLAQPADYYVAVQEVDVRIAEDDPTVHEFTATYWSKYDMEVDVETTLFQRDNGDQAEIQRWRHSRFLEAGIYEIRQVRDLEKPLSPGEYIYHFRLTFETPYGWEKEYRVESQTFAIPDDNIVETES